MASGIKQNSSNLKDSEITSFKNFQFLDRKIFALLNSLHCNFFYNLSNIMEWSNFKNEHFKHDSNSY